MFERLATEVSQVEFDPCVLQFEPANPNSQAVVAILAALLKVVPSPNPDQNRLIYQRRTYHRQSLLSAASYPKLGASQRSTTARSRPLRRA